MTLLHSERQFLGTKLDLECLTFEILNWRPSLILQLIFTYFLPPLSSVFTHIFIWSLHSCFLLLLHLHSFNISLILFQYISYFLFFVDLVCSEKHGFGGGDLGIVAVPLPAVMWSEAVGHDVDGADRRVEARTSAAEYITLCDRISDVDAVAVRIVQFQADLRVRSSVDDRSRSNVDRVRALIVLYFNYAYRFRYLKKMRQIKTINRQKCSSGSSNCITFGKGRMFRRWTLSCTGKLRRFCLPMGWGIGDRDC